MGVRKVDYCDTKRARSWAAIQMTRALMLLVFTTFAPHAQAVEIKVATVAPDGSSWKFSRTDCARSANVCLVPRSAGRTPSPATSRGTPSRVWSVPGNVGSQPWSAVMMTSVSSRFAA